jgi:hypothetical protein
VVEPLLRMYGILLTLPTAQVTRRVGFDGFSPHLVFVAQNHEEDVMSLMHVSRRIRSMRHCASTIFLVRATALVAVPAARAQDDDAAKILKAMSDYMASQKSISLSFDTDIEVITPDIQKIQFASSGKLLLSRPDKLRASRTGGYADIELIFNGKTVTVLGKNLNVYTQADAPGTIDQLVDLLRNQYGVELPGADLLISNPYEALMADVINAKHIGQGVINGVECEHLAFRNQDTDWQLWVQTGYHPVPCKFVITSKATAAAPQYTLVIKDLKTDVEFGADAFAFQPPADAKQVDFKALGEIDEVPPGTIKGETR